MAVTLSATAQLVFFSKVFGPTHPVTLKVKVLLEEGVTFEVALYSLRAFLGKKVLEPVKLTYGSTSLAKGTVDSGVLVQNKKLIEDWVTYLYVKQGSPVAKTEVVPTWTVLLTGVGKHKLLLIKTIQQVTGKSLYDAKGVVDHVEKHSDATVATFSAESAALEALTKLQGAGAFAHVTFGDVPKVVAPVVKPVEPTVPVAPPAPTKIDAVIKLRDAAVLGQKVHGTSAGSVYYTIAVGEHVKIAARMSQSGSVSIRAEWTDNPTVDLTKLKDSGVQMKQGYGSIHFEASGVPLQRVIGAFLVGTGINWKQAVMNGSELVIGVS